MGKISISFCNQEKNYNDDTLEIAIDENNNYKLFWPELHNSRQVINRISYLLKTDYWDRNKHQFEA